MCDRLCMVPSQKPTWIQEIHLRNAKDEILRFVDDIKRGISTYASTLDSRYKKFNSHNTPHTTKIVLCYIVKDHHLHPILSTQLKKAACEANQ